MKNNNKKAFEIAKIFIVMISLFLLYDSHPIIGSFICLLSMASSVFADFTFNVIAAASLALALVIILMSLTSLPVSVVFITLGLSAMMIAGAVAAGITNEVKK